MNTILIISISYCITLICVGFLVRYYRNETQRWLDYSKILESGWKNATKGWNVTMQEMIERGDKILKLTHSLINVKNQNVKYSKICRKLYDENKVLQKKIAELEKNKLKKRGKRL